MKCKTEETNSINLKDENLIFWESIMEKENCERYDERNLNAIHNLLEQAQNEICILGFVTHQPIRECRHIIQDLINNQNGTVKILLADPESEYFKSRQVREEDTVGRLIDGHNSAISEIKNIFLQITPGREKKILIKKYNNLQGDFSLQISDKKEMFINIRQDGQRGYESPMIKVIKERSNERPIFENFLKIFDDVWNHEMTKEISIKNLISRTGTISLDKHKFKIAFSFPGERRGKIKVIAEELIKKLGNDTVFYDRLYDHLLARPNLDTTLQDIYLRSELKVIFFCPEYDEKEWCGLEFRVIRDLIKRKQDSRIMYLKMEEGTVKGLLSIDGSLDISRMENMEIVDCILKRYISLTSVDQHSFQTV